MFEIDSPNEYSILQKVYFIVILIFKICFKLIPLAGFPVILNYQSELQQILKMIVQILHINKNFNYQKLVLV